MSICQFYPNGTYFVYYVTKIIIILKTHTMTTSLFNHILNDIHRPIWSYGSDNFTYDYNISETDTEYRLDIKVAGLTKSDIDITINDGVMTIFGERSVEDVNYTKQGFSVYTVKKQFNLPSDIDLNKISASVENGILNVYLSKEEIQNNEIKVKIK